MFRWRKVTECYEIQVKKVRLCDSALETILGNEHTIGSLWLKETFGHRPFGKLKYIMYINLNMSLIIISETPNKHEGTNGPGSSCCLKCSKNIQVWHLWFKHRGLAIGSSENNTPKRPPSTHFIVMAPMFSSPPGNDAGDLAPSHHLDLIVDDIPHPPRNLFQYVAVQGICTWIISINRSSFLVIPIITHWYSQCSWRVVLHAPRCWNWQWCGMAGMAQQIKSTVTTHHGLLPM